MTARERLTGIQIAIIKSLFMRGGHGAPISLGRGLRPFVGPLWRREIVQIWHRLSPGRGCEGPFYSLTFSGLQLASAICAPRQNSGAGNEP